MGHDIGKELEPYRIELRADLTTRWLLLRTCKTHDGALAELERQHREYGGQVRVVVQHVIQVRGLGA